MRKLTLTLSSVVKSAIAALALLTVALLSACGTPYATVANRSGEPVMLLGYDPVAYFTKGEPTRGKAQFKTNLPDRTYYFSSAENQSLFAANPAKYEPQYGGFAPAGQHLPSNWAATRRLGKSTTGDCSFLATC